MTRAGGRPFFVGEVAAQMIALDKPRVLLLMAWFA
jgi:hypothetical protein